jgi:hypothetical protein
MADDDTSIFSQAGFALPKAAVDKSAPKSDAKSEPSIFESAGFKVPASKVAAPPAADSEYPTPEKLVADVAKYGVNNHPAKSTLQQIHEALDPAALLSAGVANSYHDTIENAVAAKGLARQGLSDIWNRNYLPTTPSLDPSTWSPGGLVKTAAGVLGLAASPISGTVNALVTRPVTELTGSPEIGDRAGFVANALLPVRGVGKVAEASAPSTKATNALVEAIRPENVPGLVADMRANPRMTVADLSDPVRLTTQGLMAGGTPDVQDFISRAVKDRNSTRLEAANTAFTNAMGPAPDVPKMVEGLKDRARDAGSKAIQPALENAKPVDVSPVIAAIDAKLKPGVNPLLDPGSKLPLSAEQEALARVKQQLTTETGETLYDPKRLHEVQSSIGDQAYQLSKSPDPKDRRLGSQLRDMNEKLIDQIDEASGGAYRPARAKFKDAKDISEAFESGFDTLKNRSGMAGALEDSPQAFRQWMKDATPEEVVARRLGTRSDIDQKINSVKNGALKGETITAIPYNQEKLRALFGDKEAGRLIRVMQDAQREAATNSAIVAGSKTAETKAAADRIKVRDIKPSNPVNALANVATPVAAELLGNSYFGIPGVGLGIGAANMAARLSHVGIQKIGQIGDKATNMHFAKNALATGPARETTINALLSHPDVVRELQKRSNALTTP